MQNQSLETPLHAPVCTPLGEEIKPALKAIVAGEEYREELETTAKDLEYAHAQRPEDLENGQAAKRAYEVGCAACIFADVCIVGNTLKDKAEQGGEDDIFMDKVTMLASAPDWLFAARFNRTGLDGEELFNALEAGKQEERKEERLAAARKFPLDEALGTVENHVSDVVTKNDVPSLINMSKIAPDAQLTVHDIKTNAGEYEVVDASEAVHFTGPALDPQSYGILMNKFLSRMEEVDNAGNPQIFSADNNMQKVVTRRDNAVLFEMRMSGKNRMYFWVTHEPEQTPQIVIIGSHAGDAKTQKDFLTNYADTPQYK